MFTSQVYSQSLFMGNDVWEKTHSAELIRLQYQNERFLKYK